MSPGLKRAREPYRLRNTLTGLTLAALGVGIWAYSIGAVKQDVFDDVDEEARALAEARATAVKNSSLVDGQKNLSATKQNTPADANQPATEDRKGLLVKLLDGSFPSLLDPTRKTLVWGAPSVDSLGRVSDKKTS
jgi:cytochrome c oxidase assembly factor 3